MGKKKHITFLFNKRKEPEKDRIAYDATFIESPSLTRRTENETISPSNYDHIPNRRDEEGPVVKNIDINNIRSLL